MPCENTNSIITMIIIIITIIFILLTIIIIIIIIIVIIIIIIIIIITIVSSRGRHTFTSQRDEMKTRKVDIQSSAQYFLPYT